MLIIFDLDDTLIDTSGSITPHKLELALQCMEGKVALEQFRELLAINGKVFKTPHAIEEYGKRRNIPRDRVERAIEALYTPLPDHFEIPCTPNAKEILKYYASRCPIALITGGHPPFQLDKLKKAGIEPAIFSKIAVPEDSVKKPFYSDFARQFSAAPSDVWVCGDRIPMDLVPAHELGFKTVHMRWGRGRQMERQTWIDYSISELSELRNIIP